MMQEQEAYAHERLLLGRTGIAPRMTVPERLRSMILLLIRTLRKPLYVTS